MTNEIMKYLKKTGESYKLQVEDVVVEIQYSENHKKFNEATAILAGDGLLNYAYMVISQDLNKTLKKQTESNINEKELKNKTRVFEEFSRSS